MTGDRTRALPRGTRNALPVPAGPMSRLTQRVGAWVGGVAGWWPNGAIVRSSGGVPWPTAADRLWATETTVAGIPAVWKCAGFLSNAVASCAPPIQFDSADERMSPSHVVSRPWALLSPHEFWSSLVLSLLFHGNFIGIHIDHDPTTGYPRQILPVPVEEVTMIWHRGLPVYGWGGEAFGYDEVVHIRNGYMGSGNLWGVGVVEQFRRSLTDAEDLATYGRSNFSTAAENSVIIQVARDKVDWEEAEKVQARWEQRHGSGRRRPAVIPASMTITPLSFSPQDAQFLESRQFSVAEIAFMFLMDPTDLSTVIGSGGSITYANREQREIDRLTHPVGHLMRRTEQAWSDLLAGGGSMAFNVEKLLRSDTLTRMQATDLGLRNGTFTLNDARKIERLPLYGEWADEPFASDGDERDLSLPEVVQKLYPGVGKTITSAEARAIANTYGAGLDLPGPEFAGQGAPGAPGAPALPVNGSTPHQPVQPAAEAV